MQTRLEHRKMNSHKKMRLKTKSLVSQFVDVQVEDSIDFLDWILTAFYGDKNRSLRLILSIWNLQKQKIDTEMPGVRSTESHSEGRLKKPMKLTELRSDSYWNSIFFNVKSSASHARQIGTKNENRKWFNVLMSTSNAPVDWLTFCTYAKVDANL